MNNLDKLERLLREKSEKINLFSATDRLKIAEKHFPDALEVLKLWSEPKNVLDIGTGGGIPGLVLAVSRPETTFTLLDSTQKKLEVLNEIIKEMDLKNCDTVLGRCEDLGQKMREEFDAVTARALAPLSVLLEYAVGFLKVGGILYAWKGANYKEELDLAKNAQKMLNCELIKTHEYELSEGEKRVILAFKKTKKTDNKYPRKVGIPSAKPL